MTPSEIIESYVHEVARRLPHGKRNDVAFELRALLQDEIADQATGKSLSNDAVLASLSRFGRPAEVAARYHAPTPVIEASHTAHFLIWALGGTIVIAVLALLDPSRDGSGPILQWLGLLVLAFGLLGLVCRRYPDLLSWKPRRVADPHRANRALCGLAAIGTLGLPLFIYWAPQSFVDTIFVGRVPTDGLALTQAFAQSGVRVLTSVLLVAAAAIYFTVALTGRWWSYVRYLLGLVNLFIGITLAWHTAASDQGEIFLSAETNEIAAPIFALTGAFMIVAALYDIYREWMRIRPAPQQLGIEGDRL